MICQTFACAKLTFLFVNTYDVACFLYGLGELFGSEFVGEGVCVYFILKTRGRCVALVDNVWVAVEFLEFVDECVGNFEGGEGA